MICHRMFILTLAGVVSWAAFNAPLQLNAQPPAQLKPEQAAPIKADPSAHIRAAYELTKTAKSVKDYSSVIEQCGKAQIIGLNDEQSLYVKKLISWAHNRRGEAFADYAAQLTADGENERATEMDGKALSDFEIAVNNDPERWKSRHNRGVSYALIGEYKNAIADFTKALEKKPDYTNAWFNRGEIYYEIGDYDKAIIDYDQTVKLQPNDFGAITSRGHAYFQAEKYREALLDYIQAVRLQPNSAIAYANRADAYRSLSMWEDAATDYRESIRLDNQLGRAYQSAAWLMATCPDERFRDQKLAIEAAQKAIGLDGQDDYRYLDTLAAAQASSEQYEQAIATIENAIKLAPTADREELEKRMALYKVGKPYRQGMFAATAAKRQPNGPNSTTR
ncbi:MAG: tetratricopeptide (TPR) repeat protein [Pirellulaceae bacterium]|jgi:tetratricopeptide (TPR) repeat protein